MWHATSPLMPHQELAVAKLLPTRVGALFMDMGTGKSRTLIELARLRQYKYDRLFWVTPCSLRHNVYTQLIQHTNLQPSDICVWDQRTIVNGVPASATVHVVGAESMGQSNRVVFAYNALVTPDSFVAVDESTYIKRNRAHRSQRLINMSARCKYRAILTGTPTTQGIVDLYSQMAFLSPKILGYRSFWSFANNHLEYEERRHPQTGCKRKTGRIIRSHNTDYLAAKMAPYIYQIRKDECLQLPDKLYATRYCSMTIMQRELYEQAKDEILSLDYDDWSPVALFHLFTSLQTILCGFWRRPCGDIVETSHNRLSVLAQTLREIPYDAKVIIWAKYLYCVRQICEALESEYGTDAVFPLHGGMTENERLRSIATWREHGRFLVATQSIGGHGNTFNEASHAIFYADSFKYSERIQAEDRNHRIGQTKRAVYITICCSNSIDERIAKALRAKAGVLEQLQERLNSYRTERLKSSAIRLVKEM
jgi:SNF2 family DNA or RNA helicase